MRQEDQRFVEQSRIPVIHKAMGELLKDIPGSAWSEIKTYKEKAGTEGSSDLWNVVVLERSGGRQNRRPLTAILSR